MCMSKEDDNEVTNHPQEIIRLRKEKYTVESFSDKANMIHNMKYDYSKVIYSNNSTNVEIICKEHGSFYQQPSVHLRGCGCPKCSGIFRFTLQDFMIACYQKYNNLYDYSLVEYVNKTTGVNIICKEHGAFTQSPIRHLKSSGCPKCSLSYKSDKEHFISKAKKVHGNLYDYSVIEYAGSYEKINIICETHGDFLQTPTAHLNGIGCQKCSEERKSSNNEEFIIKSQKIHNTTYEYDNVSYKNNNTKVEIICKIHGSFMQTPTGHLSGQGCPSCALEKSTYNKYKNKKTILYYVCINNVFFKVGLTQTSVYNRFKKDTLKGVTVESIKTVCFNDGIDALNAEQKILNKTKIFAIDKFISPINVGWTEIRNRCFLDTYNFYTK